jgi:hypothetical protein
MNLWESIPCPPRFRDSVAILVEPTNSNSLPKAGILVVLLHLLVE